MSLNIQRQIRQNANDIRTYIDDLYKWEEKIEADPKNTKNQNSRKNKKIDKSNIPIRGQAHIQETENTPNDVAEPSTDQNTGNNTDPNSKKNLIRDATTVKDYYQAWDKVDVVSPNQPLLSHFNPIFRMLSLPRSKLMSLKKGSCQPLSERMRL